MHENYIIIAASTCEYMYCFPIELAIATSKLHTGTIERSVEISAPGSATITHVCHVPSDQEVPIAGSSAFHSLELEAESELQEIQNMLSMFDDAPTLESEKPMSTLGQCGQCLTRIDEEMKRNSDRKAPVLVPSTRSNTSAPLTVDKRGNTDRGLSKRRDEDSLDIETVLQEMGNIEGMHSTTVKYLDARMVS